MRSLLIGIVLAVAWGSTVPAQDPGNVPAAPEQTESHFFAGYITALSETRVTVSRTILGKDSSTRTFLITPETRIEGKPKMKARVTVQYVSDEEGDRALHIIVRTTQKKQS